MTLPHDAYREAQAPFSGLDVDNEKIVHALRDARVEPIAEDISLGGTNVEAANAGDLTPEDIEQEARKLEADTHNARLKNAGELEQRRIDSAYRFNPMGRRQEGW